MISTLCGLFIKFFLDSLIASIFGLYRLTSNKTATQFLINRNFSLYNWHHPTCLTDAYLLKHFLDVFIFFLGQTQSERKHPRSEYKHSPKWTQTLHEMEAKMAQSEYKHGSKWKLHEMNAKMTRNESKDCTKWMQDTRSEYKCGTK